MAVTPFKFAPFSRKHKNVKIPKRSETRAVVVDSSNTSSDSAGYFKSRFELNESNKIIFQNFAFHIIVAGL